MGIELPGCGGGLYDPFLGLIPVLPFALWVASSATSGRGDASSHSTSGQILPGLRLDALGDLRVAGRVGMDLVVHERGVADHVVQDVGHVDAARSRASTR